MSVTDSVYSNFHVAAAYTQTAHAKQSPEQIKSNGSENNVMLDQDAQAEGDTVTISNQAREMSKNANLDTLLCGPGESISEINENLQNMKKP